MPTLEEEVWEDHARQATFLWLLRDHAVRDAAYDLPRLADLDGRLEAHLDGLRLAGEGGFAACAELLSDPEGGEVFGAALMAIERWDLRGLARVLDVGGEAPDLARGLVSALGWLPWPRVKRLLPGLLSPKVPAPLVWIGLSACAVHRKDPGTPLLDAIAATDLRVRARALRAIGELGRVDLLPEVRRELANEDPLCRFWASWSATLFGEAAAGPVLWEFAASESPFAERAATTALRRVQVTTATEWVQALAGRCRDPRVPIRAAEASGDPALVPWLLEAMRRDDDARLAGGAVTMITGVDLVARKLSKPRPAAHRSGPTDDPSDEDVAMDPDESLPWPDVERLAEWWRGASKRFPRGARHLLGRPLARPWLEEVLLTAQQNARAAAAIELAIAEPGRGVFEVRAPAPAQAASLKP